MPMGSVPILCVCVLSLSVCVYGGNILCFPVDGSHWVNMNFLLKHLHNKGHSITVVRSSTSWYIEESAPHYTSLTVSLREPNLIEQQDFFVTFLSKMLHIQSQGSSFWGFVSFYGEMLTALSKIHEQASNLGEQMLENKTLMQEIRDKNFDVVLIDPGLPVGVLIAHELKLPTVFNVRWITSGEAHSVIAPSPTSYVPASGNPVYHRMTFTERLHNTFHYLLNICIDRFMVSPHYDRLTRKYFGPGVDFYQLLQGADFWLMRVDFVFEFPRPTMPNVAYIGGFQCWDEEEKEEKEEEKEEKKEKKGSLSEELELFVKGAEPHGVIVMSLGTLVKGLPKEITSEIAAAFAQLPQRVIWRHVGERPDHLGNNTLLLKWLPQNQLLAHANTRLFISHCGTNGVYESIYHSVPIVGIPLLFDQFENVLRLETRGAAKSVDVTKLDRKNFLEVLQEVLNNATYKTNMQRLSELHRDKPMRPLDSATYWIEFVMRNKGAGHLRSEAYRMPSWQYHSLDVIGFLLACSLAIIWIIFGLIRFICVRVCGKIKRKSKQE